ncbi:hypothetical protein X943_002996 [Babesia divergens]|uniref:EF-hand domain-containing protein n=1 Tax=Babesia divergens TaxID=32595 RepID=A0AAD9G7I6_BABDI|nr:hypothetical protein X943_002996 [Babesia divergens]
MVLDQSKVALQALFKSYSVRCSARQCRLLQGGKNIMNSSDVDELVRELGFAPSIKELETFKQRVGPTCEIERVQELIATLAHPEDNAENFLKFFKYYDSQNTGTISRATLEKLLANVGEPLGQEELSVFFGKTCDFGENVPYEQLVNK